MNIRNSDIWTSLPVEAIPSSLTLCPEIYTHLSPDDRILDFGTGTGKAYAELQSKGFSKFTGVDLNLEAVRFASYELKQIGKNEASFVVGDAMQLPFHDNSFNFGIMQAFLTVLFEPEEHIEVLKESSRVLKPKGKLYISEFCKTWDSPKYRERYIAGFKVTGYVATFPVLDAYSNRILYYAHHFSEHELFDILNYAGFNVIQSRNTKFLTKSGNTINGIVIIAQNKKI